MTRAELIAELAACIGAVRFDHPVRIAIDGVDASGKTTLADGLAVAIRRAGRPVVRASIDRFHRPAAVRHARSDLPTGYYEDSFDHDALIHALLAPLGPGGSRRYRRAVFDYRTDSPVSPPDEEAPPDAVLLFDGVFLHRRALRSFWNLSVFVQVDFAIAIARAELRDRHLFGDAAAVRRRYEERYVPGQRLYLASERPEHHATWIVRNDDPSHPILEERAARGATPIR